MVCGSMLSRCRGRKIRIRRFEVLSCVDEDLSSGVRHRVDWQIVASIWEKLVASLFGVMQN